MIPPTVTTAVFEVTSHADEEELEHVDGVATAVTATWPRVPPVTPQELEGTAAGAV